MTTQLKAPGPGALTDRVQILEQRIARLETMRQRVLEHLYATPLHPSVLEPVSASITELLDAESES